MSRGASDRGGRSDGQSRVWAATALVHAHTSTQAATRMTRPARLMQ
jgi:hypothetical protein